MTAAATGINEQTAKKAGIPCDKVYLSPARETLFSDPAEAASLLRAAAGRLSGRKKTQLEKAMEGDLALLDAGTMPENMDKYLALRYPSPATVLDYFEKPLFFIEVPSALREAGSG